MNNLSLISIMKSDPEFGRRISKKVEEIKQDKKNLSDIANIYSEQYKEEIAEGTEYRAKLLTEGKSRGLSEDEIMRSYGRFLPQISTPILNLLYFLLRESDNDPKYGQTHYEKRNKINEFMVSNKQMEYTEDYTSELTEKDAEKLMNEFIDNTFNPLSTNARKQINSRFDEEKNTRSEEDITKLKDPVKMEEYLYSNLTLDQFEILKKLKALTQSQNVNEATLAFKKGKELCEKYELDWERIPCYNKRK